MRASERERESIPVCGGGVFMYVCVLPFVCVCCIMETFSGSTNDYTAAKPSQWRRRRRRCEVRWFCYLILPLTLNVAVLSSLTVTCYCYFYAIFKNVILAFRRNFFLQHAVAVIFIVSLLFVFPHHYFWGCSSCNWASVVLLCGFPALFDYDCRLWGEKICLNKLVWVYLCIWITSLYVVHHFLSCHVDAGVGEQRWGLDRWPHFLVPAEGLLGGRGQCRWHHSPTGTPPAATASVGGDQPPGRFTHDHYFVF